MKEYFKINNIDLGFANHPTEGTIFVKGALNTEVIVRRGKLRISFLTPAFEITDDMHNGLLNDAYYDNMRHIDYLRMVTYTDLPIETGKYNHQITCPYNNSSTGFETYNFPVDLKFHGIIDLQEGYVHIKGDLRSRYDENMPRIPVEALKCFHPKPLLPKRKQYTWEEALEADPQSVYDLSIGKGAFNAFPSKILQFKNLERLWVGGQSQFNFDTFPDDFYDLKELHTIAIYTSEISCLSEKINQLQKLEELTIDRGNLTNLPITISELKKLEEISLKYNQLKSIPTGLCKMPGLKKLNLIGNNFKSLPKCLADIESVNIDRKYRKLFLDVSYKSENPNQIDASFFNLANYPKEKKQLEAAIIAIPAMREFRDLIFDYSTVATSLVLNKEIDNIPLGASKIGGSPDLPEKLEHPKNKNGLHYVFHAQINCEEIAPFQQYLPRTGMLYFFINDEEYAQNPIVLYSDSNETLRRVEYTTETKFTDGDLDNNYRTAVKVGFKNTISLPNFYASYHFGIERFPKYKSFWNSPEKRSKVDLLEEYMEELENALARLLGFDNAYLKLRTHSLNSCVFTQNESPQEQAADKFGGEPEEWMVLFNMESIDQFNFWDAGTLTYCVHKKDLAIKDFSTIYTSIESS